MFSLSADYSWVTKNFNFSEKHLGLPTMVHGQIYMGFCFRWTLEHLSVFYTEIINEDIKHCIIQVSLKEVIRRMKVEFMLD